jgi:hypothetical protein
VSATKNLKKARKVRTQIGHVLARLEDGDVSIQAMLNEPPDVVKRIRIYDLLRRTPKLGQDGAKKVLMSAGVWPYDRVGAVPLEKRRKVIDALPPRVTS